MGNSELCVCVSIGLLVPFDVFTLGVHDVQLGMYTVHRGRKILFVGALTPHLPPILGGMLAIFANTHVLSVDTNIWSGSCSEEDVLRGGAQPRPLRTDPYVQLQYKKLGTVVLIISHYIRSVCA